MKKLLLSILILFSFSNLYAQKKTAALAPMGSLGELNELEKRVIFNSLQESLSKYYVLASQKMYEKAEEEAFQEMDADECTESQCIAIIQELLQTEFFFMFEIVKAGSFQQMKITRVDLDGNRDVRTETCDNCSISQVNGKVDGLVKKLTVSEEIISTPTVEKEKVEPKEEINQDKINNNKFGDKQITVFLYLSTQSLGTAIGFGSVDVKKHTNYSIGISVNNVGYFFNTLNIKFQKLDESDNPYPYSSSEEYNYEINANLFSLIYKWDNIFLGYNHLISGNVFVERHYNSQYRTPPYEPIYRYKENESEVEVFGGGGIILGFVYALENTVLGIKYDRYSFRTKNDLKITGNFSQIQSYSLGLGYSF